MFAPTRSTGLRLKNFAMTLNIDRESLPTSGDAILRVAHIVDCFGAGGIAAGVWALIRATSKVCDHSVISLSDDVRLINSLESRPEMHVLKPGPTKLIGFASRLALLARRHRIDVLHCNNQFAWLDASLASRMVGISCLQTFHGVERPLEELAATGCWKSRTAARLGNAVTAVGEASRRMVCLLSGIPESAVQVIPNGVDLERFQPLPRIRGHESPLRQELGIDRDVNLVVQVAGLRPVKDQSTLLRAWRLVVDAAVRDRRPEPVLLIIGEGSCREDLQRLAESLQILPWIRFLGQRRDVETILPCCDTFILTSLSEGLSYAILEAMACGLPVVATRVGGNSELVKEGGTGFLVPPQDPDAIAEVVGLLLNEPERRCTMGDAARRFVEEHHDFTRSAERYLEIYRGLAGGRCRKTRPVSASFAKTRTSSSDGAA
ncbi:glycosyltransferase family 4 protein [Planctomyces sp. SH-PL62]|uniref:glycosyltransferase family 4 protein n=1 Tax=Planctomyces sp. SH-PL62 TaxID=1636152 RepID=UPI00078DCBF0|nr:glycosyltransferase family 4 protein [Planctomyces sp. SH-PL62]AMV39244.1 GDP-mannose-dependent alpha-(1-6)-phosphatidylinositol monomannoside mannosyltransferase [Planctomyces sp. SH-PL62]